MLQVEKDVHQRDDEIRQTVAHKLRLDFEDVLPHLGDHREQETAKLCDAQDDELGLWEVVQICMHNGQNDRAENEGDEHDSVGPLDSVDVDQEVLAGIAVEVLDDEEENHPRNEDEGDDEHSGGLSSLSPASKENMWEKWWQA